MIYKLVLNHVDLGHYKSLKKAKEAYDLVHAALLSINVDFTDFDFEFCLVIVRE